MARMTVEIDNRDTEQMYTYLEARIDVLKRRVTELEQENLILRRDGLHGDQGWALSSFDTVTSQSFAG